MSQASDAPVIVVGIGASAGGLQPLQQFFEAVPAISEMAFVIVMHLAPEHESHLATLLQPCTTMPVQQVTETLQIERNHVYVIPPNRNLSTIDSHLRLSPLEEARRNRAPIDHFLRTLAGTHGAYAIGIILSGTGSDGTIGLQRIKEAGGLAVVQEPSEAAYDGMPQSAIATGLVDLILPIQAMPARLREYALGVPANLAAADDEVVAVGEQAILRQIFTQIRLQTGQDFARYKRSTILRRIQRRMQVHQLEDLSAYARFLRGNQAEIAALYQNLLITVTNFFRDSEAFALLAQEVIPHLFTDKDADNPLRVWVAGCATGEEAYSVAILLLEYATLLNQPVPIQIFATDLSESALRRARSGSYPATIEADVSAARLARFFSHEQDRYLVKPLLRDSVLFAPHNLIKDPPFSKLDLITCRNLLIYLDREIHAQVFDLFHYALRPDGYLLLSPAESMERTDLFQAVNKKYSLFRRSTVWAQDPHRPTLSFSPASLTPATEITLSEGKPIASYGLLHQRMVERYAPPSVLVNADYTIVHISEHAGRYLQQPGGEPTNNLLKRIHPALRIELTSALYGALEKQRSLRVPPVLIQLAGENQRVGLHVLPAREPDLKGYALVIFDESEGNGNEIPAHADETPAAHTNALNLELVEELDHTKKRLSTTIEEFETAREEMSAGNEELLSINEELKSTTEELETGKEELQSLNEELFTSNAELKFKIEELGHANSDLLNLMAATNVGVIFLDRALHVKRFTPPAAAIFHLIEADLERPFAHIAHRLQQRHLPELAARVLETRVGVETIEQSAEGRWYLLRLFPYRTIADVVEGVVLTFVDISELKRAEHELKLRRQQSAVSALSRQALQGGDLDSLLTAVTVAVADILGMEFCSVLALQTDGQHLHQKAGVGWPVNAADQTSIALNSDAHLAYTLQADEPVVVEDFQTESRFPRAALLSAHAIVSGISLIIPGRTGSTYGVLNAYSRQPRNFAAYELDFVQAIANLLGVAIARKATEADMIASEAQLQQLNGTLEQRVAERTAELARSNRELDQFAYAASHDLKAPLRAIDNLANFITTDAADILTTASQEHLAKLRGRVKRMEKLLNDLLAYSRAGRIQLSPQRVDTRVMVTELVEEIEPPLGFTVLIDEALPILATARVPLELVLRNLIDNAIKHHTRCDGQVAIAAQDCGDHVEFSVIDDGPGIAEQYHTRIFELFQTLKPRDQVEGSGMGLAMVKKIVESQGGAIRIESSENHGTAFYFTWPKQLSKTFKAAATPDTGLS